MPDELPYIISDEPQKEHLGFGFKAYAKTLADVVANKKNATPLVLGIYGSWGSGKTTLMHGIEAELTNISQQFEKRDWPGKDLYRLTKTVWFQAWKYAEEDAILAALIDEIIKMIKTDDQLFGRVKTTLEEWSSTLRPKGVVSQILSGLTAGAIDLKEIFPDPEFRKKLGFYHEFIQFLDRLIWAALTDTGLRDAKDFDDSHGALVIFIDDLDRCPHTRVLKVLETIKLFLDKKGCVFILGAAEDVIEAALGERYGCKDDTKRFMDKIVQVTFALPQPTEADIGAFLEAHISEARIPQAYRVLIAQSLRFNVRSMKRFLNNLSLRQSLASTAQLDLGEQAHAMIPWTILELGHSDVAHLIRQSLHYVSLMQQAIQELEQQGHTKPQWFIEDEILEKANVIRPIRPFLKNREIVDLVNQLPSDPKALQALIGLTSTVGTLEEFTEKQAGVGGLGRGTTFTDMVKIPAGPFLYGEAKEERVIAQPYLIDVYPVTNAQFRQFIDAGGYEKEINWSEEGLKWKNQEKASAPQYWGDEKWNVPDHPVVGVCWYEAEAFAKWAGKRLPTELEWERAARSTDGREYPWGDTFDSEKCNGAESKIGHTTPVTKYPGGISPDGCFDMAGNVWEWTEDWFDKNKSYKEARGGSWDVEAGVLRSSVRDNRSPASRDDFVGFRCAQDAHADNGGQG